MAAVINDKSKSMKACQLLGQGFNRLMKGSLDDFFLELGVPDEWSISDHAATLTASTFDEQMKMFEDADIGLKWQWFTDFENDEYFERNEETGLYVAKVDIRPCQT